jgi:cell division protein FtsN
VIHPNGITLRNQHNMSTSKLQSQRGSTLLGFILGLVIGLTVALGVAMYVTKVPMPFSNKNQSRSAEQDAVESQKNKDWNPNGALQSKPATAETPADSSAAPASNAPAPAVAADPLADLMKKSNSGSAPASPAASAPAVAPPPAATPQPAPAPAASPATTPAANKAAANDPFTYFVQAGAFKSASDADAQKAKLSMMGIESKVSERDQAGRTIYRVRSGPFDDKEQAEKIKARLDTSGIDAALVRVQR